MTEEANRLIRHCKQCRTKARVEHEPGCTTMTKTIQNQFHPDLVLPPGETIKESLMALGMKQAELGRRLGVSEKYVIDLINGDAPLTAETALKLERVFNVPSRFWTNLEQSYRDFLARKAEAARLSASVTPTKP